MAVQIPAIAAELLRLSVSIAWGRRGVPQNHHLSYIFIHKIILVNSLTFRCVKVRSGLEAWAVTSLHGTTKLLGEVGKGWSVKGASRRLG